MNVRSRRTCACMKFKYVDLVVLMLTDCYYSTAHPCVIVKLMVVGGGGGVKFVCI